MSWDPVLTCESVLVCNASWDMLALRWSRPSEPMNVSCFPLSAAVSTVSLLLTLFAENVPGNIQFFGWPQVSWVVQCNYSLGHVPMYHFVQWINVMLIFSLFLNSKPVWGRIHKHLPSFTAMQSQELYMSWWTCHTWISVIKYWNWIIIITGNYEWIWWEMRLESNNEQTINPDFFHSNLL